MSGRQRELLDFAVTKVLRAYRHKACRASVFIPLFGNVTPHMNRRVPLAFFILRRRWRSRCAALAHANCPGLTNSSDATFVMNCPPFGVHTHDKAKRCGRPLFCPFCFARQRVLFPFRRLEVALYGVSGPYMVGQELWERDRGLKRTRAQQLPSLRPDLKVIWFRRKMPLFQPGIPFDIRTLPKHVEYVRAQYIERSRKAEFNEFRAEHGFVGFDLYPDLKRGRLNLIRYGVLLVPSTLPDEIMDKYTRLQPDLTKWDPHVTICGDAPGNKKGLYTGFSHAVRYSKWMLDSDPVWCASMVRLLKKFRGISNYGKVNGIVTFKKNRMPTEDPDEDDFDE